MIEANIVLDGNLNISKKDSLLDVFNYQIDGGRNINVERRLLDDPKQVEELSYELTFREGERVLLADSLKGSFPPRGHPFYKRP